MISKGAKFQELVEKTKITESKNKSDTLVLWEAYKNQALMWRSIALLQIPATLGAIILCFSLWGTRSITLNVPLKPAPGIYEVKDIYDVEFIDYATDFINLIASYQPNIARRQFDEASKMLREPMLSRFENEILGDELKAIESTSRTQLFFIDSTKTNIERTPDEVNVSFTGDRLKIVAGKELPTLSSKYTVTLKTIPRNRLNPYGIVITNVVFENLRE